MHGWYYLYFCKRSVSFLSFQKAEILLSPSLLNRTAGLKKQIKRVLWYLCSGKGHIAKGLKSNVDFYTLQDMLYIVLFYLCFVLYMHD